jgi:hypothetical protein
MKLLTFILGMVVFTVSTLNWTSSAECYQQNHLKNSSTCSTVSSKTYLLTPSDRKEIVDLTIKYAKKYNVKPAIPLAVAHVESAYKGQEFRVGKVGHKGNGGPYYAPYNIHYSYLKRGWPINTLEGNVEAGVRCFAGMNEAQALRRLRTYNTICDSRYVKAVRISIRRYEKEVGRK